MPKFTHLHVHTQYSILDGAAQIKKLLAKARETGMTSLAITDHGNMYGVMYFMKEAKAQGIKPIIGIETYVANVSRFEKNNRGHHLILLAKNLEGYHNLAILSTLAFKEGFYYNARIDKEILRTYSKGIIASSACLGGEIPQAIMAGDYDKAEQIIKEFKDIFGDDFFLELMDHGLEDQKAVNRELIRLARKHDVKLIATNDVHFVNREDAKPHQILICLNTQTSLEDAGQLIYTGNEYLRTPEEMAQLFAEIPEAIENTQVLSDRIEEFKLEHPVVLPRFELPGDFTDQDEYLHHLTFEGVKRRYQELTPEITDRIDFELATIKRMGFPGYFLIVQDFIAAARNMGVMVGPGRGSAAGSAVAYCLGITNIDPIKYKLLFERFLNPERISMPDIDVDFDDAGRDSVLKYVTNKYGEDHVAQIITFGTMAAKSAIRDVARVLKLPLPDADRLAKMVPERPGTTLSDAFKEVSELREARDSGEALVRDTLRYAETLEGSARQTGTHACGVIIGPDDLKKYVPLATAKDSLMMVTQYDGKFVESVGMLKMDFLGLRTLTIIKEALSNIRESHKINIDVDTLPLDDKLTFELFQRGDTIGIFQFESDGMRQYMRELKPTTLEDLIAMNALYRPGPIEYIPDFIDRKHGRKKIEYDLPDMEEYLNETYGITVYQEQVMLLSQKLAGFTKGDADVLRKAMGKKDRLMLDKLKPRFIEQSSAKGHDVKILEKVWTDWEAFASYAFNKSHSTCYAWLAYQTAYLKAHHPAEFMSAVLTHNLSEIKKITFFIEECQRQGIDVLGPDLNESRMNFFVNSRGQIRFGLAAIKGVGESAVRSLLEDREANGPYENLVDFLTRINLRTVNRKCMESLAMAGALDCFEGIHRAQYFAQERADDPVFLDRLMRMASQIQERKNSSQVSLFGEVEEYAVPEIELPKCPIWSKAEQLKYEKDVTGFYISGHPLDEFKLERENFCNVKIADLKGDLRLLQNKELYFAGMVTGVKHKIAQNGKPFGTFTVEDVDESIQITVFSEDYLNIRKYLTEESLNLMFKSRVQKRYSGDTLELKVVDAQLLSDVMEKFVESVKIFFPLETISSQLVETISKTAREFPGNCPLHLTVVYPPEKVQLQFRPKKLKVNPNEFLRVLRKIDGLQLKLNRKLF
ncbi:MAG TPA: DNA polymerase III subunit alpha [Bacteroidales bacterium]|nr:MAG: DNA polymerase III subunit alpha [Bacteroidetes bacterium GWE2_42_24]OFY29367.1 MAG: DNA polymerase III subunit alpha [Bacteroidetes bacterium GWF2_43_11]HBZ67267.1 DNA polymerase III subunit alpha [Bacteroidales bacterium]